MTKKEIVKIIDESKSLEEAAGTLAAMSANMLVEAGICPEEWFKDKKNASAFFASVLPFAILGEAIAARTFSKAFDKVKAEKKNKENA